MPLCSSQSLTYCHTRFIVHVVLIIPDVRFFSYLLNFYSLGINRYCITGLFSNNKTEGDISEDKLTTQAFII